MQFKVRDGFAIHLVTMIEIEEGTFQKQENQFYGGQVVELTPQQAEEHAHKLEAFKDKTADAFLASKVLPVAPGAALGLSAETVALVEAMATKMAAAIISATQSKAAGEQVQTPAPGAE